MERLNGNSRQIDAAIDITKLIMAYLVIAIHTEPLGFSFWLDKGFGILTRCCVPFFFVTSSYFFFVKENNPLKYIKRIFLLYFVWSIIYLPFDVAELKEMTISQIFVRYFWIGNGHALWYLCGSLIGFLIVFGLSRVMSPRHIFYMGVFFLFIGCLKSTYAPLTEELFNITVDDFLGSRNGLFYAFPYYAVGLLIAKEKATSNGGLIKNVIGVMASFILLVIESIAFVVFFKTNATILWISVLPLTYNLFLIIKKLRITISEHRSYYIRKLSTMIYVSHCIFIYLLAELIHWRLFIAVSLLATVFSIVIITISGKKYFKWFKILF